MHNNCNKDSGQSSVHSISNCLKNYPSWWNSSGPLVPRSSYSKNSNMNSDSLAQPIKQLKPLGHWLPDQDSSSTQSTGQSHQEASRARGDDDHEQCVPAESGNKSTHEKHINHPKRSISSLGTPDAIFSSAKVDCSQPFACFPYHYADPCYGGLLNAYGSHAIIHPQMLGMTAATRVPLPLEPAADEPIYVNAKQYHGILRRRQLRAKREAKNKHIKSEKPYLHESRHHHAMNRPRGSGGRFLNKKKLEQETKSITTTDDDNISGSLLQLAGGGGGNLLGSESLDSETGATAFATPVHSEVTTISNGGGTF